MLRDGQFLREPPIKIGAHYVRPFRHEPNDTEVLIQSVLMGYSIPKKRTRYEIVGIVLGVYCVGVILASMVRGSVVVFGG